MEHFLGLMLDLQPRPTQAKLRIVPALSSLTDGFIREYKKEWMDSFWKHLETYDENKLENAMEKVMKSLASTLSRQHGVQYVFGPQFHEYTAKKAAGILKDTHLKPLSEKFTEDELQDIPFDNKVGENYFGQMTN